MGQSKVLFYKKWSKGVLLIFLGGGLVLDNLDIVDLHFCNWWPLIFIAIGLVNFINSKALSNPVGWIFVILGGIFLLPANNILSFGEIFKYWPLVFVFFGVRMIFNRLGRHGLKFSSKDEINEFAIFGGLEKRVKSEDFKGGSVSVTMGIAEIDLRSVELSSEGAVLDVTSIFGLVEIHVPKSCPLDIRSGAIFSHVENKCASSQQANGQPLVIKIAAIFSEVEILN